jgi:coatomer subunit gamma
VIDEPLLTCQAITTSIVELMTAIPETKDSSLFHLCEFIEDCEFSELSTQILHLIGVLGPTTASPARCVPFLQAQGSKA